MKLEVPDFQSDERGVSPVIGVILMVAITVILAAVIGAFVLDLGSQLGSTGPQSQLAASDASSDNTMEGTGTGTSADTLVTVEHKGGDDLKPDELKIIVTNAAGTSATIDPATSTSGTLVTSLSSGNDFTVGESFTISEASASSFVASSQEVTVKVIHKPSNSVITSTKVAVN